ncbi:MAG TPA: bifunctional diguanylate cyclase/phosphodiesterase, partial [Spirochaetia bacterium]|nr:bifunctional diguanylate cyclase/phosphodiesterase [Spirochaetia bacterium]
EAVLFGVFFVVVFPQVSASQAVVLAAFVTGLLAAGTLSKMTFPAAAVLFAGLLGLAGGVGLALAGLPSVWVAEGLLFAFTVALSLLSYQMSGTFDARYRAEQEVARQKALVADLLEDFSSSSSDALWETDASGLLLSVSPRLAELHQKAVDDLVGSPLIPVSERNPFPGGRAFRNLEIPVELPGGTRWWSLTGKPLRSQDRVTGWRGVATDITERRGKELEVVWLSRYDALTGLLNRQAFRDEVNVLFRDQKPGIKVLALVDLERFKDVNEVRGHAFGDALLVAVANRLKQILPPGLVLARLDGDEFGLQGFVDLTVDALVGALDRLLTGLEEPFQVLEERFETRFHLGVAVADGSVADPQEWLRCADLALRVAKLGEGNQVQVYEPSMSEAYHTKNRLRAALGQSLAAGQLSVFYQPLFLLDGGQVTGFEALVRWTHPQFGSVPPSTFIPLAEETEFIQTLGLWVLEEACNQALGWPAEVSVSVNVSGVQLRSPRWEPQVRAILHRVGLDPHRLILEVTESALVRGVSLEQTFASLRSLGVRWALDDFGTGYSALSYLQDFPFDKLKIDQSFVRPARAGETSGALLAAIVSMAGSLGLTTTAEGIEDQGHWELLGSLGCREGQGYLFSPPVPGPQVGSFFQTDRRSVP